MMGFATSAIALRVGAVLALAAAVGGAYLAIDSRAVARCESEHELVRLHAAEEAHQFHLAEVARGNALSAELAKTQRRLSETKSQYLAYAYGITGNCPAALGMLNNAAASGIDLPASSGPSTDSAAPISANAIGANIAENYARCLSNSAQLSALIQWHARPEKDLTP